MTSRVIYHDFRSTRCLPTALTAPMLAKGRRLIKAINKVNTAMNAACIFLCGVCTAVSLFILVALSIGG